MEISAVLVEDVKYGVSFLFAIILSYTIGRILAPLLIALFARISQKTKSSLDDRILNAIKDPLVSFFFVFVLYWLIHLPYFRDTLDFVNQYVYVPVILLFIFFAYRISDAVFKWYYEEGHKTAPIKIDIAFLPLISRLTEVVLIFVGFSALLSAFGIDISSLLAITSLVVLVVGLAAQETLANLFAGIALQLDQKIKYGDYLRLPTGEIARLRKIGLRSVKLIDFYNNTIVTSNSDFARTRVVILGSRGKDIDVTVSFEAPLKVPVEEIEHVLRTALHTHKPAWYISQEKIPYIVDLIKAPGWYQATFFVRVTGPEYFFAARSFSLTHIAQYIKEKM